MIIRSRRRRVSVPTVTTQKLQTQDVEYKKGLNTNLSNDDVPSDQFRLINDAREIQIGKWMTRKGNDPFSVPIGDAINAQNIATTGAFQSQFSTTTYAAQRLVATSTGVLTSLDVNIRTTTGVTGTVVVALYNNSGGVPGTPLASSTIAANTVTNTFQYLKARFITCPDVTNGATYWIVMYIQAGGTGSYEISNTTAAATGMLSFNSGMTWTPQVTSYNVKMNTATAGGVKGTIRIRRPNGATFTFFAHGTTLYSVNETTGVTTSIDTNLNTNATYCRFAFIADTLYYVTGLQKPRKYDFTSATEVTTAPENASNVIEHKGVAFFMSADDPTKSFYSNFAQPTVFTSTDFLYIPAPKTADPVRAIAKLNGILFYLTRNSKYALYGSQNATFQLDAAVGQTGTFSQESIAVNKTSIYMASDDGIFRFNGAEEANITTDVLDWWVGLNNRENTVLEIFNNRLYVFYTPNGEAVNTRCRVYNILYNIWESEDTKTYVGRTSSRQDVDGVYIQGSNRAGFVMKAELPTNDYNTMGEPLNFELRTNFNHYDSPAQYKRCTYYRPHFDAASSAYSIQIGWAFDYNDSPTYFDINLQPFGSRFDTTATFDSTARFESDVQINPTDWGPVIPGEWRRLQLRYKHTAAREPVAFDGHVLALEVQRLT